MRPRKMASSASRRQAWKVLEINRHDTRPPGLHSYRNVMIGSARVARRAGIDRRHSHRCQQGCHGSEREDIGGPHAVQQTGQQPRQSVGGAFHVARHARATGSDRFGIRMALGAKAWDVVRIVLSATAVNVGAGLATGLLLSLIFDRVAERRSG